MTIITKIILENITTHKYTEIDFKEGINVLSGDNGVGKSSIVKMIGFVLFNYLPLPQKKYVRRGKNSKKTGKATIHLLSKDNELYSVSRTLGGGSQVEVKRIFDEDEDEVLYQIDTVTSLEEWLQEQMEINENYSLNKIFENAIGVAQGTFTTPFLLSKSNRENIFRPLLNVDIYRKIWKNYIQINKSFEEELQDLDTQIQVLEKSVEGKAFLKEDLDNKQKNKAVLSKELHQLNEKNNKFEKQYEKLTKIKSNLDEHKTKLEILKNKQQNTEKNISGLKEQIIDAQTSKEICQKTQQDYKTYVKISNHEKILQKEYEELLKMKDKKAELEKTIIRLNSQIEELKKSIDEINSLEKEFRNKEIEYKKWEKMTDSIQISQKKLNKIESYEEQLSELKEEQVNKKNKLLKLEKSLKKITKLRKSIELVEILETKITQHEKSVSSLETEINSLLNNKNQSVGGMCPFLNEKCKNIEEGDLEVHFESQIKGKKKELKLVEDSLKDLKSQQIILKESRKELDSLLQDEAQFKSLKQEIKQNSVNIAKLESKISDKEIVINKINTLNSLKKDLKKDADIYIQLKNRFEVELPQKQKKYQNKTEKADLEQKKIDPLEKRLVKLPEVENKLSQIREKKNSIEDNYNQYISNEKNMANLEVFKEKMAKFKLNLKKIQENSKEIHGVIIQLEKSFDEDVYVNLYKNIKENTQKIGNIKGTLKEILNRVKEIEKELSNMAENEKLIEEYHQEYSEIVKLDEFSQTIRTWFNEAGPKITEVLLEKINSYASKTFSDLMEDLNVQLEWLQDYDVIVRTPDSTRYFSQLSGGEQMSAAIAIRLAILKYLTNIDFAFFDEPTTNLDTEKRTNLSEVISKIQDFKQLFVISHDNTFEQRADYVIRLEKDDNEVTRISI